MTTRFPLLVCFFSVPFLGACGVLMNGTSTRIPVDSEPQGAEVWLDGVRAGVTPLHIQVANGAEHTIVFKRPGEEDQTVRLDRQLQGGTLAADIFLTGFIGVVVDAATGGWYTATPVSVSIQSRRLVAAGPR